MKDLSVTLDAKKSLVEQAIRETNLLLYNQDVNIRVGKKSENKEMVEGATERMIKLEKQKDAYQDILNELEEEIKKGEIL